MKVSHNITPLNTAIFQLNRGVFFFCLATVLIISNFK